MSKWLLVSNLSESVNNLRLEQLFARHGRLSSARIVVNEATGKSQGFGHVQMPSDADADRAIVALDGYLVDGREISVTEAPPSEEEAKAIRPRYGNGRSGGGGVRSGRRA